MKNIKKMIKLINGDKTENLIYSVIFSVVAILSPVVTYFGERDLTLITILSTTMAVTCLFQFILNNSKNESEFSKKPMATKVEI